MGLSFSFAGGDQALLRFAWFVSGSAPQHVHTFAQPWKKDNARGVNCRATIGEQANAEKQRA